MADIITNRFVSVSDKKLFENLSSQLLMAINQLTLIF